MLNRIFTAFFTLEALVKVCAYGRFYFKDNWNLFDFTIAVTSGLFSILELVAGFKMPSSLQVIRAFRISRVLKLFKNMKIMRMIVNTFV